MAASGEMLFFDESGVVHLDGVLKKKRTTRWPAIWQDRHFTLRGKDLSWSQEEGGEALGVADLSDMEWVQGEVQELVFNALEVNKQRVRLFVLKADSYQAERRWREALAAVTSKPPAFVVQRAELACADPAADDDGNAIVSIGSTVQLTRVASEPMAPPKVTFGSGDVARVERAPEPADGSAYVATYTLRGGEQAERATLQFLAEVEPLHACAPSGELRHARVSLRELRGEGATPLPIADTRHPALECASLGAVAPCGADSSAFTVGSSLFASLVSCHPEQALTTPNVALVALASDTTQACEVSSKGGAFTVTCVVPETMRGADGDLVLRVSNFSDVSTRVEGAEADLHTAKDGAALVLDAAAPTCLRISCKACNAKGSEIKQGCATIGDRVIVTVTADKPVRAPEVTVGDSDAVCTSVTALGRSGANGLSASWECAREMSPGDAPDGPLRVRVAGLIDSAGNVGRCEEGPAGVGAGEPLEFSSPAPYDGEYSGTDEEQVVAWMFDVLGDERAGILLGEDRADAANDLLSRLRDGIALCELANAVTLRALDTSLARQITINYVGVPDADADEFAPGVTKAKAKLRDNIGRFLDKCKAIGVTSMSLFQADHLYEERDLRAVLCCVKALSRRCHGIDGYCGPCIGRLEAQHKTPDKYKHSVARVGERLGGKAGSDSLRSGAHSGDSPNRRGVPASAPLAASS